MMNNYLSLFTLPQWADFTLYHMGKPFRCSSILLRAISPVIKDLDDNSFTLPSIKGSLKEVFGAIFSFKEITGDFKSINLLIATIISLDIKKFRAQISNAFNEKTDHSDEIYLLASDLSSHNVSIDDIVPIIASNFDFYFQFFANDNSYESFTPGKLNLYARVFSDPNISTTDSHNLFKLVSCFYKMFPDDFNDSITNLSKRFFNEDIFRYLLDLQTYDLNQIKDCIIPYLSNKSKLKTIYTDFLPISIEYHADNSEMNDIFHYIANHFDIQKKVKVTSSDDFSSNFEPVNLIIREEGQFSMPKYFSCDEDESSVTFQLIDFTLKPSAYGMTSWYSASEGSSPISWRLEASFNGDFSDSDIILLDEVDKDNRLCADNTRIVIHLKNVFRSFSWFRISQTKSKSGSKFNLAKFELFGELIQS